MHHFNFKNGELHCEDIPLKKIASEIVKTNSDSWWFGDKEDEWWVSRNRKK